MRDRAAQAISFIIICLLIGAVLLLWPKADDPTRGQNPIPVECVNPPGQPAVCR